MKIQISVTLAWIYFLRLILKKPLQSLLFVYILYLSYTNPSRSRSGYSVMTVLHRFVRAVLCMDLTCFMLCRCPKARKKQLRVTCQLINLNIFCHVPIHMFNL